MKLKVRKRLLYLLTAVLCAFIPSTTLALNQNLEVKYGENNILYYEPEGNGGEPGESEECEEDGILEGEEGTDVTINSNVNTIATELKTAGYNNVAIAAILGNLMGESGAFEPRQIEKREACRYNGSYLAPDDFRAYQGGGKTLPANCGFGIAQWTSAGRVKNLQDYADSHSMKVVNIYAQTGWLIQELANYGLGPSTLNSLTLKEALERLVRDYESPANPDAAVELRYGYAITFLDYLGGILSGCTGGGNPGGGGPDPDPPTLISGGMTLAEAQAWMETYRTLAKQYYNDGNPLRTAYTFSNGKTPVTDSGCKHGTLNNCSAFSQWFVNNYTSANVRTRQGSETVSMLTNEAGFTPSSIPIAYSVFSSSSPNHTGVILGVDADRGTVVVGEASCHNGFSSTWPRAREYTVGSGGRTLMIGSSAAYSNVTYADPGSKLSI